MVQPEQFPRSPGHHPSPYHHPVPDAANSDMLVTCFAQPQPPKTTKLVVLYSAAYRRVLQNIILFFQPSHQLLNFTSVSFLKNSHQLQTIPKPSAFSQNDYLESQHLACELNDTLSCALLSSGCCCSLNLFNSALQRCPHTMLLTYPRDMNRWTNENLSCKWFLKGLQKNHLTIKFWYDDERSWFFRNNNNYFT